MYNYSNDIDVKVDINIPKPLGQPDILKIDETSFISRQLLEKRGTRFYDVILTRNNENINIGRFNKEEKPLQVSYNKKSNKLMLYYTSFNNDLKKMVIVDVLGLYDIIDEMFLVLSKEEAAKLFDPTIDTSYIKNKEETVLKNDLNKRKKIR